MHNRIRGWPTPTPCRRASGSCGRATHTRRRATRARAALRLDPGLAEPHASLGRVKFSFDWDDGQGAEQEFLRALAINPNYATAHQWYAVFLATRGRLKDALAGSAARKAEQSALADHPLERGANAFLSRRARRRARGDCDARSSSMRISRWRTCSPRESTRSRGASTRLSARWTRIREADVTSESLALDAYIAAIRGDRKTALGIVQRLEADPAAQHVMPYYVAKVYAALKEPDQAFAYLERAADEQAAQIVFMGVDPEFAPLRGDPRLAALAKRVGVVRRR